MNVPSSIGLLNAVKLKVFLGTFSNRVLCFTKFELVIDAFDEPAILNITKGETVTCSANASVPCTYRWFYGNDTLCPASCDQVLTTTRLEDYSCEASCTINDIRCTFVAMRIFVNESPRKRFDYQRYMSFKRQLNSPNQQIVT